MVRLCEASLYILSLQTRWSGMPVGLRLLRIDQVCWRISISFDTILPMVIACCWLTLSTLLAGNSPDLPFPSSQLDPRLELSRVTVPSKCDVFSTLTGLQHDWNEIVLEAQNGNISTLILILNLF